ncbi:MAG: HEPN domain-containing protein [Candidatus Xenobiia bacterium LiM19]
MEKARNDLETSEILFDNGRFVQSVNRSYYAMFHAARALMAFEGYDSRTH